MKKFTDSVKYFVYLLMALIEVKTGRKKGVKMAPVEEDDYKVLTKRRYHFVWKSFRNRPEAAVYKLQIPGEDDIHGVMAIVDIPSESRMEISLLACAREHVGTYKIYEGVAGHLIAFACRLALTRYGRNACVSLTPKTALKLHYIHKYGMLDAGRQLFLEGKALNDIILKYLL